MLDRHSLGELALAVLLMLPLATLAKAHPPTHQWKTYSAPSLTADRSPAGRIGIFG